MIDQVAAPKSTEEETAADARERSRRRDIRSIAIALALVALVLLFYAATVVRLGGNVLNRAL